MRPFFVFIILSCYRCYSFTFRPHHRSFDYFNILHSFSSNEYARQFTHSLSKIDQFESPYNKSQYSCLLSACNYCVSRSIDNFASGSEYYSNPKAQMGTWVDRDALSSVLATIMDTEINIKADFSSICMQSSIPIIGGIVSTEFFDINLVCLPSKMESPPFTYAPGTLQFYKSLVGELSVISMINDRIIQNDVLSDRKSLDDGANSQIAILQRLGGPTRYLQNLQLKDPAIALEVILHPPSPGHASFDGGIGVKLEQPDIIAGKAIMIAVPEASKDKLLVSFNQSSSMGLQQGLLSVAVRRYRNIRKLLSRNIGGLGKELDDVVRRLLLTRQLKKETLRAMGISHVKGVLFYGPPGTGKTLLAREMARALNARRPKVVNGPEILDKYVGEAERNIRALFADAEKEWERRGEDSALHVIIFDEIDAIAKKRGSLVGDGSGTRDSCVNQLLSKMDGVGEMTNVLVVGLTNRRDLIDPALLRPGRFEARYISSTSSTA